jgi:hypothetical protein
VPFDWPLPDDWPPGRRRAPSMPSTPRGRRCSAAMDASIKAHADQETLYDKPELDKTRLRITGPFSVEAVPAPTVLSLDDRPRLQRPMPRSRGPAKPRARRNGATSWSAPACAPRAARC